MKPGRLLLFGCILIPTLSFSSVTSNPAFPEPPRAVFALRPADMTKLTGKKMNLKQKLAWSLLKKKLHRKKYRSPDQTDHSRLALIFAITGLIIIAIPVLNFFSIPLAIMAIIFGSRAKRADPSDRRARTAITIGILTLGLALVIGFIVLYLFSNATF